MGNRAVITTREGWKNPNRNLGIYLHWNGGRDSVEAFLTYCKLHGYNSPETRDYGWASLTAVITNFFGASGLSIGIDIVSRLDCDNGDNGVYIIEGWNIVERLYHKNRREQQHHKLADMLEAIDEAMPEKARLGADFLRAEEIPTSELKIGDKVFVQEIDGTFKKHEVIGFGEDIWVNGTKVKDMPYVNRYCNDGTYTININNYIRTETVRAIKNEQTEVEEDETATSN